MTTWYQEFRETCKSSDDLKSTLERLTAKIDELSTDVRALKPLAPVADKMAAVPDQIVRLQAAAFDNTEQLRALNLAMIRAENTLLTQNVHSTPITQQAEKLASHAQRESDVPVNFS
jgi:outer membrane murein-binding lipoprotein Lpp